MADPQQNQDPFAQYSPEDRESIANQLDALQKSGKLNPAQTQGVGRAMGYLRPPKSAVPQSPATQAVDPTTGKAFSVPTHLASAPESIGQKILNAPGVGATLETVNKYAVEPFEALSKFGAEQGGKSINALQDLGDATNPVSKATPEQRGSGRAVGEVVGSMITDPRQWPLLGTGKVASPVLKKGMDAGFAALMGQGVDTAAEQAGKVWDDKTPEGREARANAITHMVMGTTLAGVAGSGAAHDATKAKGEDFTNKYSDRVKQAVSQPAPTPKPTSTTPEDVAASVDQTPANGLRGEDKITPTAKKASPPKPSTKVDTIAADNAELQKAGMPPTMKLKPSPKATPEATVSSGGTGALSSEEISRGQNGDKHYYVSPEGNITYQGSQPDAPPQTIARGGAVVRYNPRRGWDTVNGDSSLLPKFKRKLDTIQGSPSKVEPAERAGIAPATPSPTPMKAGDAVRSETAMDTYKSTQADIAQVDKDIAGQTKARGNALREDQPRIDQELSALQQKKAALQTKLQSAFSEHAKGLSSKDALDLHENLTKELTKTQTAREQFDNLLKGDVQAKGLRSLLGQMIPRDARTAIHNMLGDVQLANVYDPKILKFVNSASLKAEVKNTRMIIEEAMKDPDLDPKTRKMYENFMAPDKKGNPKAVVFRPKQVKGAIGKDAEGNVVIPGKVPELTTAAGNWLLADGKKLNMTSAELRGRVGKMGTDAAARQAHLEMLKGTLERAHNIPDLQTRRNLVDLRNGTVDKAKLSDKQLKGILQRPEVGKALLGDKWEQARTELGRELLSRKPEAKPPVVQAPPVEAKTVEQPKLPSASYFPQEVMDNPAVKSANDRLAQMDKPTVQAAIKKVQQKIDLEGATKQTAIYRQALQQRLNELSGKGRQPDAQQVADMSAAKAANGTVAPKVEKPSPKPRKPKAPKVAPKPAEPVNPVINNIEAAAKMRDEQEAPAASIIDKVNQQARLNEIAGLLEKVPQRDREPLKGLVNDIVPKGKDRYEGYKLALNAYHDALNKPEPGITPLTAARAAINKFFVRPSMESPADSILRDYEKRQAENEQHFEDIGASEEERADMRTQVMLPEEADQLLKKEFPKERDKIQGMSHDMLGRAALLASRLRKPIPVDLRIIEKLEGLEPKPSSGGAGAAAPDLKQQLKDAGMKDADVNRALDANPDDPKAAIKYLYRDRVAQRVQAMRLADHLKVVLPNDPDLMVQMQGIINVAEKNGVSQAEMVAINNEMLNKPRTMAAAAGGEKPPDKPIVGKSMSDIGKMFTPEPIEEAPTPNREALTPEARAAAQRVQELLQTSKLPDLGRESILGSVQKLDLSRSAKVFRWERALKIYKEGLTQQDPMALRKALDSINDNTKMAFGLDPSDYLNVPQAQTVVPELDAVRAMRAAKVAADNPGMLARSMAFVRRMPDWAYRTFYEQFPDLKGAVTAVERATGEKVNNNPYYAAERTANQILGTISSIGKRYGEVTRDAYKTGLWDATSKVMELRSYNHALETLEDKVSTAENQISAHSKAYDLLSDAMRDGRVSPKAGARKLANLGKKLRDAKATAKELSRSIDNGDVLPGGYTRDMVEDHLNMIEDQLGPDDWAKVNAYGDKLYAIHREHLVKLHEAGMVSDDAMATFLARGMDHAPQYRYLDAVAAEGRKNGGNLYTSDVDVLKPLLGSDKLTKDPVESMMKWDMRAANLISKNNVAKSFSRFGEQFGLATRLKSRAEVPAGEVPIPVWETSQEAGEYQDEPDNESNTETVPPPPGGQRIYYSVPAEIADNLAAVNSRQLGALEKVLRYFKVPFQAGATTANLAFALPNALRHVLDYHILAPSGAGINPVEHAKFIGQWADSLMKVIKSDPSYVKDFLPSGAAFSTYQSNITPGAFLRDVASGASPKPTIKSVVMAPIHSTERLVNVLEEATKFTAFKRELAKSGSMEEAVHNTLNLGGAPNFRNMGTAGQMMNLLFPFSNAHLRYTGRVLEHIDPRTPEGQNHFIRLATAVTLSELALAHWNAQYKDDKGNPEYDHVPDQEKQQNWYMLLPTTYQTSDGFTRHNAVKVPKPTAIRLFSNTIGSVIDHGMGGRTSLEQIPADFVSQFMPGQYRLRADDLTGSFGRGIVASANPAIREPYEQAGNLDAWKNRPIVPKYMEGVEHPYDTNNTVHSSVEAAASKLGMSPLRLQHGVRSELAGLGDQAMDVADKFFPDKPRGDEDILEGDEALSRKPVIGAMVRRFRGTPFDQVAQDNEEKFYRMLGRAEMKQTTSGFLERQNHPDFAGYYTKNVLPIEVSSAYKEAAQSISEYRGLQREVLKAKMAPASKRTALKGINTAIQTIIETTNRAYSQYVQ